VSHERRDGEIDADRFPTPDGGPRRPVARAVDRHTDAAISLGSEDGTMTCDVPSGLDLSALPVGARRKPHRHRPNGRLQAVVEVPH
jgi:hypothetical protein